MQGPYKLTVMLQSQLILKRAPQGFSITIHNFRERFYIFISLLYLYDKKFLPEICNGPLLTFYF